ncbi:LysR family transcriptional regulator [Chenggangzhangella methanolivorans]|uniref:LysR family transcriptional regulator n=1 Tax=Chenggangzhangella methanolivorans TaxID=1437009 RepID=A0A9E6R835_9HYPH|nr:LysR family transcriptional regulator [Chenggangzhangella methanolivorans]QZN99201.1 LysR family transcriptional regulator [Chenggangzhangella methanolivorans]
MIDIRQMRYFVALAETLHFGRAAERLRMSQPPLSRQIASLEAELGVRLLERHSRQASLTFAGQRFLEDCRTTIAAFDQACENARMADRGELGELSIGFMMSSAYTVLPALARRFTAKHPRVALRLRELLPPDLEEAVKSGRFDAGIMFDVGGVGGLEARVIHREALCLAAPSDHPLALKVEIAPEDLGGVPLIIAPAETTPSLREAITGFCRRGGFEPTARLEAQLQQTIVSLVSEGLGVAVTPSSMRKLGVANVVYRDLVDAPQIEHVVAWRPANLNPALRLFLAEAGAG